MPLCPVSGQLLEILEIFLLQKSVSENKFHAETQSSQRWGKHFSQRSLGLCVRFESAYGAQTMTVFSLLSRGRTHRNVRIVRDSQSNVAGPFSSIRSKSPQTPAETSPERPIMFLMFGKKLDFSRDLGKSIVGCYC